MLFFWDFNERSSKKKDLQMVVLKSEEKVMENGHPIFSNDEGARPPALPKKESTEDILIGQVDKFQSSYFKEHLWKVAAA